MGKPTPFNFSSGEHLLMEEIRKKYGLSNMEIVREALRVVGVLFYETNETTRTDSLSVDCLERSNYTVEDKEQVMRVVGLLFETNALVRSGTCESTPQQH